MLTFPFAYDLEKLLSGTNFCFTEDDNVRDISNSSLRRKLFGQPDRQVGGVVLCHSHPPAKVASGCYEGNSPSPSYPLVLAETCPVQWVTLASFPGPNPASRRLQYG